MGWGQEPHEGWADEQYPDGRWNGGTHRGGDPDPVIKQAACSCGWRSEQLHPVAPRPADLPRNERGIPFGPEYDAWCTAREQIEDTCWEDWNAEHYEPMLGYEPHTQLILGRSDGGPRHYLDGHPVHAGAGLEVLLDGGQWLAVRYEWGFAPGTPPTAHFALGIPTPAAGITEGPVASFELPPRAILRWPAR